MAGVGVGGWRYVAGQQAAATATAQYEHDYGACGVVVVEEAVEELTEMAQRFADLYQVASATARIALSQHVASMQTLKQDVRSLEVPKCLNSARTYLEL